MYLHLRWQISFFNYYFNNFSFFIVFVSIYFIYWLISKVRRQSTFNIYFFSCSFFLLWKVHQVYRSSNLLKVERFRPIKHMKSIKNHSGNLKSHWGRFKAELISRNCWGLTPPMRCWRADGRGLMEAWASCCWRVPPPQPRTSVGRCGAPPSTCENRGIMGVRLPLIQQWEKQWALPLKPGHLTVF